MIDNDLLLDQIILDHESHTWAAEIGNDIKKFLEEKGYVQTEGNITGYTCDKSDKISVTVSLIHNPNEDLDASNVLITDVVTQDHLGPTIPLYPEVFGFYYHNMIYDQTLPSKKYNCFINRACGFRQSWFYQLIRHQMLDQGHVSYWCHDRFTNLHPLEYFEKLFQENNVIFKSEHDFIKNQIPFKNFQMTIEDAIIDSEKSLVIETFFSDPRYITFSEKTWRVIQLPRPWILFATVRSIDYLRSWGFDVFDDVIDHSYDLEIDSIKRQIMCLEQLKKTLSYDKQTLIEFESRAKHNRDLLKKYRDEWPVKYKNVFTRLDDIVK
jgi:hypothetical protein